MLDVEVRECPECKELATFTFGSSNVVIDCGCGSVTVDTMIEQDTYYVIYERFMAQYRVVNSKSILLNLMEDL